MINANLAGLSFCRTPFAKIIAHWSFETQVAAADLISILGWQAADKLDVCDAIVSSKQKCLGKPFAMIPLKVKLLWGRLYRKHALHAALYHAAKTRSDVVPHGL